MPSTSKQAGLLEGMDAAGKAELARKSYGLLGLAPGCGEAEVRTAYRKTSRLYHPDKQQAKDDTEKKVAASMFLKIQEAYELLSDATQRVALDAAASAAERAKKAHAERTSRLDETRRKLRDDLERREAFEASRGKGTTTTTTPVEAMRRKNADARDRYDAERRKATVEASASAAREKRARDHASAQSKAQRARRSLKVKWGSKPPETDLKSIFSAVEAIDLAENGRAATVVFQNEDDAVNAALDENVAKHFKDVRLCSHDAFDRVQAAVKRNLADGGHDDEARSHDDDDDEAAATAAAKRARRHDDDLAAFKDAPFIPWEEEDDLAGKRARLEDALKRIQAHPLDDPALARREFDVLSRLLAVGGGGGGHRGGASY